MTRKKVVLVVAFVGMVLLSGCSEEEEQGGKKIDAPKIEEYSTDHVYPKVASWLAKKDEILSSGKPYSLVMSGWFTPEEADQMRSQNPEALLLAGLTVNWVYDEGGWKRFLETVAGSEITEEMYLKKKNGERCPFGWASESWGHSEIYTMDPRNTEWVELITSFYGTVLDQPQHDGIIVDMVTERSWCPGAITDEEWVEATRKIMAQIAELNTEDNLIIFNAGRDLSEIDAYSEYMDGYLMENFLGDGFGASFEEGLRAADDGFIVIYAVDTDDTGKKDMERMRLGLTLSLLSDTTYVTYDFGPRDHGQAWWFPEYDAKLGAPQGRYYTRDDAYWREFEHGVVVASPHSETTISFEDEHVDLSTGVLSKIFEVEEGDGRIFILSAE